jgi:hypothetical protein
MRNDGVGAFRGPAVSRLAIAVDGDGGEGNLKDYPIEENPELTTQP